LKNQQRPVARIQDDGRRLLIHSIFPTIQGEGPYAGRPALFVRLAGCNLQCPACDTEYSVGATHHEVDDLVPTLWDQYKPALVVITGGEPFRQNVSRLVELLCDYGIAVQLETNGMFEPQGLDRLKRHFHGGQAIVVVSPKNHRIWSGWGRYATAFKYVVERLAVAKDGLPVTALGHPVPSGQMVARPPDEYTGAIYVQPQDDQDRESNRLNEEQAVRSVLMDPARRILCLQLHKMMGLP
jgi:7-carboxy-7-deazaguanine synthase